jgi:hypothetical protein
LSKILKVEIDLSSYIELDGESEKKTEVSSQWSNSTNEEEAKKLVDCFPNFIYAKYV